MYYLFQSKTQYLILLNKISTLREVFFMFIKEQSVVLQAKLYKEYIVLIIVIQLLYPYLSSIIFYMFSLLEKNLRGQIQQSLLQIQFNLFDHQHLYEISVAHSTS